MSVSNLFQEYNRIPIDDAKDRGRKSFMTPRAELNQQQLRELRTGHLNPGHSTAEEYNIAPITGRGSCQPVTRDELLTFVNEGKLPARLVEWERQCQSGTTNLPRIEITASTVNLH